MTTLDYCFETGLRHFFEICRICGFPVAYFMIVLNRMNEQRMQYLLSVLSIIPINL